MPKIKPMTYARHKERWKDCDKCSLCEYRTKVVLARGQPVITENKIKWVLRLPCEVLFIGEAPGVGEDSVGKPFVGPAGDLFQQIVDEALQINHDLLNQTRVAFTNIVACIPKEDGKKAGEPPKEAINACAPRLLEFIKLAKPSCIVRVGKLAHKHVPVLKGIRYANVMHPAAIIRMQNNPAMFESQIQKSIVVIRDVVEVPF